MKITSLETIRNAEYPALISVRVNTDENISGLGETSFGVEAVEAFIYTEIAIQTSHATTIG